MGRIVSNEVMEVCARAGRHKMVKVTIRLPEEDYNKLKRIAAQRSTSMSQVIREGLRLLFEQEEHGSDT